MVLYNGKIRIALNKSKHIIYGWFHSQSSQVVRRICVVHHGNSLGVPWCNRSKWSTTWSLYWYTKLISYNYLPTWWPWFLDTSDVHLRHNWMLDFIIAGLIIKSTPLLGYPLSKTSETDIVFSQTTRYIHDSSPSRWIGVFCFLHWNSRGFSQKKARSLVFSMGL